MGSDYQPEMESCSTNTGAVLFYDTVVLENLRVFSWRASAALQLQGAVLVRWEPLGRRQKSDEDSLNCNRGQTSIEGSNPSFSVASGFLSVGVQSHNSGSRDQVTGTIRFLAQASPYQKTAPIVVDSAHSKLPISYFSTPNGRQLLKTFVLRNSLRNLPCGSYFLLN